MCEVKSAPAMNLVENSRLVAVMRRNEEKVKDYAKRHQVPKWYTDGEALINDPDVNAIYIATPPDVHKDYTLMAAEAGKPVYVEKPMARTYAECQDMIQACEKAKVPLYVAYYRRALPHFLKIKSLIDEGAIGDVRHVSIQMNQVPKPEVVKHQKHHWRVDPSIAGGGYFYDLASHQLDFLDFALGPIQSAKGMAANQAELYAAEDMVVASFVFESGVLGSGSWCFASSKTDVKDITVIYGSKGSISYETFGAGNVLLETDDHGKELFEFSLPKHIQMPLIQLVVGDLLGLTLSPSDGVSGSRTNQILEAIVGKCSNIS